MRQPKTRRKKRKVKVKLNRLPFHSQNDERPESVLTDVTVDGLGEPDLSEMSGIESTTPVDLWDVDFHHVKNKGINLFSIYLL